MQIKPIEQTDQLINLCQKTVQPDLRYLHDLTDSLAEHDVDDGIDVGDVDQAILCHISRDRRNGLWKQVADGQSLAVDDRLQRLSGCREVDKGHNRHVLDELVRFPRR